MPRSLPGVPAPSRIMLSLSPAPPLTQENVLAVLVEGKNLDFRDLQTTFGIISASSLKDIVEQFLHRRGYYEPSWRTLIFTLDDAGKTQIADCIKSYGEPIQGVCVYVCARNRERYPNFLRKAW